MSNHDDNIGFGVNININITPEVSSKYQSIPLKQRLQLPFLESDNQIKAPTSNYTVSIKHQISLTKCRQSPRKNILANLDSPHANKALITKKEPNPYDSTNIALNYRLYFTLIDMSIELIHIKRILFFTTSSTINESFKYIFYESQKLPHKFTAYHSLPLKPKSYCCMCRSRIQKNLRLNKTYMSDEIEDLSLQLCQPTFYLRKTIIMLINDSNDDNNDKSSKASQYDDTYPKTEGNPIFYKRKEKNNNNDTVRIIEMTSPKMGQPFKDLYSSSVIDYKYCFACDRPMDLHSRDYNTNFCYFYSHQSLQSPKRTQVNGMEVFLKQRDEMKKLMANKLPPLVDLKECPICRDVLTYQTTVQLQCRHEFCKSCLNTYFNSIVQSHKTIKLGCPICHVEVNSKIASNIIDDKLKNKIAYLREIEKKSCCPKCHYYNEISSKVVCVNCGAEYCPNCSNQPHPNISCEAVIS
jgi:hypothetical protein